jgi:hypothetical protein
MIMPIIPILFIAIILSCLLLFNSNVIFSHAILFENGTCTNENLTENFTSSANQSINTNGTVDDFLQSLPSDNTILAELLCQDSSDEAIAK